MSILKAGVFSRDFKITLCLLSNTGTRKENCEYHQNSTEHSHTTAHHTRYEIGYMQLQGLQEVGGRKDK